MPVCPWSDLLFLLGLLLSSVITTESWWVRSITAGSRESEVRSTTSSLSPSSISSDSKTTSGIGPPPQAVQNSCACLEFTTLPWHVLAFIVLFGSRPQFTVNVKSPQRLTDDGQSLSDLHKNLKSRFSSLSEHWSWFQSWLHLHNGCVPTGARGGEASGSHL